MKYRDLRDFVHGLEQRGLLRRLSEPVSTRLEMTALADRVLRAPRSRLAEIEDANAVIELLRSVAEAPPLQSQPADGSREAWLLWQRHALRKAREIPWKALQRRSLGKA